MPVLAFRAAELIAGTAGYKDLHAVAAQTQRRFLVSQHEAEHHLNSQQQGVEIPYDRRLVQQGYMIARRVPVKSRHALPVLIIYTSNSFEELN